ncbi:MAG: hypothetical protein J6R22_00350 [Alphaproteobacteria bacterium]|nr:hypothetical protein [Alphaproteobacteria bacterium]
MSAFRQNTDKIKQMITLLEKFEELEQIKYNAICKNICCCRHCLLSVPYTDICVFTYNDDTEVGMLELLKDTLHFREVLNNG